MIPTDRDQIRQTYLDVWQKLRHQQWLEPMEAMIADIIQMHPEYHPYLSPDTDIKQREFIPDGGQTNPFLHMGMHIALREQTSTDRPAGIKAIYQRLAQERGQHKAEHDMMECLGQALWQAQRDQKLPDEVSYMECLKKL